MLMEFYVPEDLIIINNEDTYILKKGLINKTTIEISKQDSSKKFVESFQKFIKLKKIILSEENELYNDYMQLCRLNLIKFKINCDNSNKVLILTNTDSYDFYHKILNNRYEKQVDIKLIKNFIIYDEIKSLNENKDFIKNNLILKSKEKILSDYSDIYVIDSGYHINRINAMNKIGSMLEKSMSFFIYDNQNIYITKVQYKITGCFQCLEQEIDTKLKGKISTYEDIKQNKDFSLEANAFILSILTTELKNLILYKKSTLTGNYIHFYIPTYEYEYNINRIQTTCPICSTVANLKTFEQNIKTVNLLKELKNDINF